METCFRCERSEKEVRLLDAIYENDTVKVCERCAITENIPIIRKPSTSQLRESEKAFSVYQRMRKLAGLEKKEEKHETILEQIRKLDESPETEMPEEKKPFNLIDNFHWIVARARRNKGLSQRQLGWALGESEAAVKMIEKGDLPEDSEKLIKKLEQFFQIKIRERTEEEIEEEKRKRESREKFKIKPLEKEPEFEEVEEPIKPIISEEDIEEEIVPAEQDKEGELEVISSIASGKIAGSYIKETEQAPSRILSFKPDIVKNLTISDLKRIKEEREKAEKIAEEEKNEKMKIKLREKIGDEMKDIALGKKVETIKQEKKEEKKEWNRTPTISELMERKKEKDKEKMIGGEIELEESFEKL